MSSGFVVRTAPASSEYTVSLMSAVKGDACPCRAFDLAVDLSHYYPSRETMTSATSEPRSEPLPKGLRLTLRIVQWLLAVTFVGTAIWKVATPIPRLAAMIPWAGEVSPALLYGTALFDLLGGLGVLLPSLTRIKPGLTVLAALGCAALQASAIVFHISRGEVANTPFNCLLLALALLVAWGSHSKAALPHRA
ncbi:MAG TPA: DoxX family protein [Polyangiaceae bacterium]